MHKGHESNRRTHASLMSRGRHWVAVFFPLVSQPLGIGNSSIAKDKNIIRSR